jgi:lysophospholipase L1-like esterase
MNGAAEHAKQHQSRSKRWAFRASAMLLGLSPFLIAEAMLRIADWQPPTPIGDPFVDFQSIRPLFIADDHKQMMVTAANRLEYFRPESFAIEKHEDEFRIFCVGGSTVQGRPYAIETSFTKWLELALQAADSSRRWEVINCGGVSYASYRLVPVVQEILRYEPDLIVLYTGHNEFLEDRSYQFAKNIPEFVADSYAELSRLKTLQYLHGRFGSNPGANDTVDSKEMLSTEVQALLDYQGGLEFYHRDAKWRRSVVDHFEFNLRRIIDFSTRAEVPIAIVDPPANLIDCPPFKSEHTSGLTAEELSRVQQMVEQAIAAPATDRSIQLLEQAIAMDPDHAGTHFQIGSGYTQASRSQEAKRHFRLARDEDICPLRITEPLTHVIRTVATDTETPCIEVRRKFEELSEGAIPGNNLFFDHVHPSFRGHQVIALEIIKTLQAMKIVKPNESWQTRREVLFNQHWNSLDPIYFARGQQRLDALKLWTQGRSEKLRDGSAAK